MPYQRSKTTIAVIIPFALGLLHLTLLADGISVDDPILSPLDQSHLPATPLPLLNHQNEVPQKSDNSAFLETKYPALNGIEVAGPNPKQNTPKLATTVKPKLLEIEDRFRKDLGEPDRKETDTDRAADLGLAPETYATLRDLLKVTAGIDLSKKQQEVTQFPDVQDNEKDKILERDKRAYRCPESPPGLEKCIPCADDEKQDTFEHTDESGNTCECIMCMKPKYIKEPCLCTSDGRVARDPTCDFPVKGKTYMSSQNWCSEPFPCTETCPDDLVITEQCVIEKDAVCGCPDGTDQIGETACAAIPLCQENFEIVRINKPDAKYPSDECQPCPDGYIQPQNNSLEKCYPRPSTKPDDDNGVPSGKPTTTTIGTQPNSKTASSVTHPHDISTKENGWKCKCPEESTIAPPDRDTTIPQQTIPEVVPTGKRYLSQVTLAICWIFTVIVALIIGVIASPWVMVKYRKWCDKFDGRHRQGDANACFDGEDVAININENENQDENHNQEIRNPATGSRRAAYENASHQQQAGGVRGRGKGRGRHR